MEYTDELTVNFQDSVDQHLPYLDLTELDMPAAVSFFGDSIELLQESDDVTTDEMQFRLRSLAKVVTQYVITIPENTLPVLFGHISNPLVVAVFSKILIHYPDSWKQIQSLFPDKDTFSHYMMVKLNSPPQSLKPTLTLIRAFSSVKQCHPMIFQQLLVLLPSVPVEFSHYIFQIIALYVQYKSSYSTGLIYHQIHQSLLQFSQSTKPATMAALNLCYHISCQKSPEQIFIPLCFDQFASFCFEKELSEDITKILHNIACDGVDGIHYLLTLPFFGYLMEQRNDFSYSTQTNIFLMISAIIQNGSDEQFASIVTSDVLIDICEHIPTIEANRSLIFSLLHIIAKVRDDVLRGEEAEFPLYFDTSVRNAIIDLNSSLCDPTIEEFIHSLDRAFS